MPLNNEVIRYFYAGIAKKTLFISRHKIGDAGAQALAEALRKNHTLTWLGLDHNQISDAGAQALAETMRGNRTLTELRLGENQIGDAGAQTLTEVLIENHTLTNLALDWNQIGDAGAQALAEVLSKNRTLTRLGLFSNQIGDAGAQALAKALRENRTLTLLDLGENQIGTAGAQDLAKALRENRILTWLNLGLNQIGDAGAQDLAKALRENHTLTWLDLGENQIGDAGAQALLQALDTNHSLFGINLGDNAIDSSLLEAIEKQLKRNYQLLGQFFAAVEANDLTKVKDLLAQGVSVLATSILDGGTALHYAVRNKSRQMIELLLSHGANPQQPGYDNKTPLDLAHEIGDREIILLLEQANTVKLMGAEDSSEIFPPASCAASSATALPSPVPTQDRAKPVALSPYAATAEPPSTEFVLFRQPSDTTSSPAASSTQVSERTSSPKI